MGFWAGKIALDKAVITRNFQHTNDQIGNWSKVL